MIGRIANAAKKIVNTISRDAVELARASTGDVSRRNVLRVALHNDSFAIVTLYRGRRALHRLHLSPLATLVRLAQTAVYGIEIDRDAELGHGVYFVHPLGTVVGGTSKVGDRVRFYGNNTVGTAKDNGYPTIGDDVRVGCGARILGPVHIGERAVIGANAVVLSDVPSDAIAVGIPARVATDKDARGLRWGGVESATARRMPKEDRRRGRPNRRVATELRGNQS